MLRRATGPGAGKRGRPLSGRPRAAIRLIGQAMEKARPRHRRPLLVVDDDEPFRERLVRAFVKRLWDAHGAADGQAALELARAHEPGRAIVDLRIPDRSGLTLVGELLAEDSAMHVLVLTGYGSIATAKEAIRAGAIDYLTKPADADEILAAFDGAEGEDAPRAPEAPSLARVQWEHIQRVLSDCEGNVTEASRILGIHRRSLQRKLAQPPPKN